jgi:hypothetical protein
VIENEVRLSAIKEGTYLDRRTRGRRPRRLLEDQEGERGTVWWLTLRGELPLDRLPGLVRSKISTEGVWQTRGELLNLEIVTCLYNPEQS